MQTHSGRSYSGEAKLIAALCYLLLIVVPVVILATDLRRERFLQYHAYQGLAAGVALLASYLLVIPSVTWVFLSIPCIGGAFACLTPFVYLALMGLQFYWAYLALQGHLFSIPVLGPFARSSMRD